MQIARSVKERNGKKNHTHAYHSPMITTKPVRGTIRKSGKRNSQWKAVRVLLLCVCQFESRRERL